MRLAAKLVSTLIAVIIVLLAIEGQISVRHAVDQFRQDTVKDAHLVGHALRTLVEDAWRNNGRQYALRLLTDANKDETQWTIRWVWLDAPDGAPHHPRTKPKSWEPLLKGSDISLVYRPPGGPQRLVTYVPLTMTPDRPGALEVTESLAALERHSQRALTRTLVLIGMLVLVSGLLVVALGYRWVGKPLRLLIDKTDRVGAGELTGPLQLKGHDELSLLAQALNQMCANLLEARQRIQEETAGRIAALEQLRHQDRLKTVGLLASGIAHELGTPLNVVSGRAGLISAGKLPDAEVHRSAEIIRAQAERMTGIIRQLLTFARQRAASRKEVDLADLARQTIEMLAPLATKNKVTVGFEENDEDLRLVVDGSQIQQVMTNLVVNAIQAMPAGGKVSVGAKRVQRTAPGSPDHPPGDYLAVWVQDEGQGIAPADLEQLFDPFYTTKDVGQGTGLGLSIAYGIVRDHGGWIEVSSKPQEGSRFTFYLPSPEPPAGGA